MPATEQLAKKRIKKRCPDISLPATSLPQLRTRNFTPAQLRSRTTSLPYYFAPDNFTPAQLFCTTSLLHKFTPDTTLREIDGSEVAVVKLSGAKLCGSEVAGNEVVGSELVQE